MTAASFARFLRIERLVLLRESLYLPSFTSIRTNPTPTLMLDSVPSTIRPNRARDERRLHHHDARRRLSVRRRPAVAAHARGAVRRA